MNTMKTGESKKLFLKVLDEKTIKTIESEKLLGKAIYTTFNESGAPLSSFLVVDFGNSDCMFSESFESMSYEDLEEIRATFGNKSKEYIKARLRWLAGGDGYHLQLIDVKTSKPYDCFSRSSGFQLVAGWMNENSTNAENSEVVWISNFYFVCEEDVL